MWGRGAGLRDCGLRVVDRGSWIGECAIDPIALRASYSAILLFRYSAILPFRHSAIPQSHYPTISLSRHSAIPP